MFANLADFTALTASHGDAEAIQIATQFAARVRTLLGEEPDPVLGFSPATAAPGAPTRAEIVARYRRRTGRNVQHLHWYEALALWKIAILLEGSYKRFIRGTTNDQFFARLEDGVPRVAATARDRISSGEERSELAG